MVHRFSCFVTASGSDFGCCRPTGVQGHWARHVDSAVSHRCAHAEQLAQSVAGHCVAQASNSLSQWEQSLSESLRGWHDLARSSTRSESAAPFAFRHSSARAAMQAYVAPRSAALHASVSALSHSKLGGGFNPAARHRTSGVMPTVTRQTA